MAQHVNLLAALATFDAFKTPARMTAGLRSASTADIVERLPPDRRADLDVVVTELAERDFDACVLGDDRYPAELGRLRSPPPVLFMWGNPALLSAPGIGMCGSRNVSDNGIRAASACGEEVASLGQSIVSGYAKGVDTETHLAALRTGGRTVIVLAEGITHFRKKRAFAATGLDADRVLVLSQFLPHQRWSVGAAMTRNGVITGMSKALVVIEAGPTGGTLNAGLQALQIGRPVLALQFSTTETPAGNQILIEKGAIPVRSRQHLARMISEIPPPDESTQLQLL